MEIYYGGECNQLGISSQQQPGPCQGNRGLEMEINYNGMELRLFP